MKIFRKSSGSCDPKELFAAINSGDNARTTEILGKHPHLVNAKGKDDLTPLKLAARSGHLGIVKTLVEKGAEVYSNPMACYPAVMEAAWAKHQDIVDYFLHEIPDKAIGTNGLGVTINLAGRQGWKGIVVKHLQCDPLAVHQRGWIGDTPLHWPCHNGYEDIVTLLLDAGADIEADEINWIGGKPLHWASEHQPGTTRILLERGASVNSRNIRKDSPCFGRTPLIHNASQKEDCFEIAELLLQRGADKDARDARGRTALQAAEEKNNVRIAAVLRDF